MSDIAQSSAGDLLPTATVGRYVPGVANIAAGVLDLVWRGFDQGHQPIGNLGIPIPHVEALAVLAGLWLILAGSALLWK